MAGKSAGLHMRKGLPPPKVKRKPLPPPTVNPSLLATLQRRDPPANIITIVATPDVLVIHSEDVSSDNSEPNDLCNSEWSSAIILSPPASSAHLPAVPPSRVLFPPPALQMNLDAHKSPTT